jgi:hypothetical protein
VLRTLKVRDIERPAPLRLLRQTVELSICDERGRPKESCIIERDYRTSQDDAAEASATLAREQAAIDRKILRAIATHGTLATSQSRIRLIVNARSADVAEAISRLMQAGWIVPPSRQRQPYVVTDAGRAAIDEAQPCE